MHAIKKIFESTATIVGLWIAYNMLILGLIMSGWKMEYIPYLHFPIKFFLLSLS